MIEDRRLHRAIEELGGMTTEELVQSILAGEIHSESLTSATRPAPHLPQARHRAGEGHAERCIKLADVDPQLKRVRRNDPEQITGNQ